MLTVRQLSAYYDSHQVLHQIDFDLAKGQILAVLGRNGAGRSSLAKALMGLIHSHGSVTWQNQDLSCLATHQRANLGLAYVPETRDVFPTLTVLQNLYLGIHPKLNHAFATLPLRKKIARLFSPTSEQLPELVFSLNDVWDLFPALLKRQNVSAGKLSGGEQQMLSLARALLRQASLLIVDEPTEGLAPMVVQQIAQALRLYQAKGGTVVLIEQKLALSLELANNVLVLGQGQVQMIGSKQQFLEHATVRQQWLEVSAV